MSEIVEVEVKISERCTYARRVRMPRARFEDLRRRLDAGAAEGRQAEEEIGDMCDRQDDWLDADDLEVDDFEIIEAGG